MSGDEEEMAERSMNAFGSGRAALIPRNERGRVVEKDTKSENLNLRDSPHFHSDTLRALLWVWDDSLSRF